MVRRYFQGGFDICVLLVTIVCHLVGTCGVWVYIIHVYVT